MDQVYNFDKSLQQRLREYRDVFGVFELLPACDVSKAWGFYLELTIDPNGWQAIWKLSRATCETLEIPFPTIVLVFVLSIDYSTLQALVRVIAVQDDEIHLPEKHRVPLIHLWPTRIQDKSVALNLYSTADVIDMLRFFYTRLFMPWDLEDEDTTDWRSKHLESRLRLFYDMSNSVIPKVTSKRINYLLTEARRLQSKKDMIKLDFNDNYDDSYNNITDTIADINLNLCEIRCEMEILEDPLLRKALIKRQKQNIIDDDSKEHKIWLIHHSSPITNILIFLDKVKKLYPHGQINIQHNFSLTLENGGSKDTYILSEGKYKMNTIGALDFGGTLKGIASCIDTVLVSNKEDIMLDFQEQSLVENLTIDASSSQCAALVRRGKVTFSNCKIFGCGRSTHQGIIVLDSGELELINCEILGFYTAIIGNSGSKITMKNTDVHNVNFGLKIYDKSCINTEKCTIRYCKDYAICVETENNLNANTPIVGGFDVLNVIPEVKTELISGGNNIKGDVLINCSSQMNAMEDLFSILDPTISEGPSEEENQQATDDFEKTVVKNSRNISPATV